MFDVPPRPAQEPGDDGAAPDPLALGAVALRWQVIVGRDWRPSGVRIALHRSGSQDPAPLSMLLDGIVRGFVAEDAHSFPRGLVLLAPMQIEWDPAMALWSAPRNVLLEIPSSDLEDETRARILFESRGQGVRQALRQQGSVPASARLQFFQYLVGPASAARSAGIPVLALDVDDTARAQDAWGTGVHALIGRPLPAGSAGAAGTISPSQKAIFELVRLVQSDADMRALERVLEADPLLAYMLLTLANSAVFRRGAPTASLRQAIAAIGYQRLVKWLVLILALSNKDGRIAPAIFTTLVRGYCMENLGIAAGCSRNECDECFIVGAFSLLDEITGLSLPSLFGAIELPPPVIEALVERRGPYGNLLEHALQLESRAAPGARAPAHIPPADERTLNRALLQAIAAADAMIGLL